MRTEMPSASSSRPRPRLPAPRRPHPPPPPGYVPNTYQPEMKTAALCSLSLANNSCTPLECASSCGSQRDATCASWCSVVSASSAPTTMAPFPSDGTERRIRTARMSGGERGWARRRVVCAVLGWCWRWLGVGDSRSLSSGAHCSPERAGRRPRSRLAGTGGFKACPPTVAPTRDRLL